MNILPFLASSFDLYLTLERVHPSRTYDYKKKGFVGIPVIEVTQHGQKCKQGESWMYVATPLGAKLDALELDERLYVGAQTQDRMFRGDGLGGDNYHHAQMRSGNGVDTPVAFLKSGRRINIHRISATALASRVSETPELRFLVPLLRQPKAPRKHVGYWFEQYVLFSEPGLWRWNTAVAEKAVAAILNTLS
jgi:hypothetical protein